VLDLPKGFSYRTPSAEGDPIAPGVVVPGHHDGTATFPGSRRYITRLVRDHEQDTSGTKADPDGRRTKPVPLEPLGRFAHEAVCVDPRDSVAYLTEDASKPFGLFYRFRPRSRHGGYHGYLAGG
jgi:secreted PhoX family phosphatase